MYKIEYKLISFLSLFANDCKPNMAPAAPNMNKSLPNMCHKVKNKI